MVKSPLARMLLCLAVLALIGVTALALGTKPNYVLTNNGRTAVATKGPSVVTPRSPQSDAGLKTIAGNLSTYPYGTYFCCFGNTISGGGSDFLSTQFWEAIPFTPAADATVTRMEVSVGAFDTADAGAFQIQLLADNNNSPGDVIKTFDIKTEPIYGTCCTLDVGNDKAGIAVTAGTQYWIAVTTSKKQTTLAGGWAFNSTDMRSHEVASWCSPKDTYCGDGGVWVVGQSGDPIPGYAVLGH
ncbi:MAG TPA: choice-of-anchor R domain-containing protein [Terriglobales bacterium]|nr:choice-of-anchor R domain-containing protein [Terriglobales bacterium]